MDEEREKCVFIMMSAYTNASADMKADGNGMYAAYDAMMTYKQSNKHSEKTRPLYNEKGQQVGSWGWEQPTQNPDVTHDCAMNLEVNSSNSPYAKCRICDRVVKAATTI